MIKVLRKKDETDTIRRIVWVSDKTEERTIIGLIGQVYDMYKQNLIYAMNVKGNEDKWLVIWDNYEIKEFDSVEDAREYAKSQPNSFVSDLLLNRG